MKKTPLFLSLIVLSACAKDVAPSETISDNAINATTALEQALPEQCKGESVITQIGVIKTQIRAITQSCELEKEIINKDKIKWKWAFWGLLSIICVFVIKKILK